MATAIKAFCGVICPNGVSMYATAVSAEFAIKFTSTGIPISFACVQ